MMPAEWLLPMGLFGAFVRAFTIDELLFPGSR